MSREQFIAGAVRARAMLALIVVKSVFALVFVVEQQWARARASGDRGSESVEKAVLVAIGLAIALGLAVAIRAAVQKYQAQIN
ncbi:hypothetical protein [Amycolatopsis sp. La24]|uniref:hypothetical protein n=1 Tax=Amycolatopsis sp. La24 TaxID=3028304 RepID=UPI0023B07721|nr:hypothetical protein [Amycolatopsis sp. La24]